MTEKVECEIWIAINEDGAWVTGEDVDSTVEKLMSEYTSFAIRTVKITAKITPPTIIKTELDIPDEAGEIRQIEATAA